MVNKSKTRIKSEDLPQIKANLTKEYVGGGGFSLYLSSKILSTLPHPIDDITNDFGSDLYERMMYDGQVAAAVNLIKLAILAQGIRVANRYPQEDPAHAKAQDIVEFIQRNLNRVETGFEEVCYEMLDAIAFGNKMAEQIYELSTVGEDKGKILLKDLKVKPRRVVAFVVDAFRNVKGIMGVRPNIQSVPTNIIGAIVIPSNMSIGATILPRAKFFILSWRPKDSDPRGTSILRPAYNAWWIKTMVWPEYLKYLAQFAGPMLWGTTAEGATVDSDGKTPESKMLDVLLQAKNGSAMAFPYSSLVGAIKVEGDGTAFLQAVRLLNEEITKAILYQTLATGDSVHMARAASQTHQDVLDLVIRHGKLALSHAIEEDVVTPLVLYNFGAEAVETLLPQIVLPDLEIQDFADNATAIATLTSVGYFSDEQFPAMDNKLGIKERDMKAFTAKKAQEQQMQLETHQANIQSTLAKSQTGNKTQTVSGKPGGIIPSATDPSSLAKRGGR